MLVQFQNNDQTFQLMQKSWATDLNPLLKNPVNQSLILPNVSLKMGVNVINHTLGRVLQGWVIVRQRAAATFYDLQDTNSMPQLTLILNASAPVIVNIEVF